VFSSFNFFLAESLRKNALPVGVYHPTNKSLKNSQLSIFCYICFSWCNPCKILAPRLEELVAKQEGKVELAKVDVDSNSELAFQYGVSIFHDWES